MKVFHLLFGSHALSHVEVLKRELSKGDILVVSPDAALMAQYDAILDKQLRDKLDAEKDLKVLADQLQKYSADEAYHRYVETSLEKVYSILCQGMSLSFQDDSLHIFLREFLVLICGKCVASLMEVKDVVDGRELIVCEGNKGLSVIDKKLTEENVSGMSLEGVTLVAGTYGKKVTGETVSLGKRGSELTANIIAAVLRAEFVRFYVAGYEYDEAPRLSYEEAAQCFSGGVPVYPPAMQPAKKAGIPIQVADITNEGKVFVTISSVPEDEVAKGISGVFVSGPLSLVTVYGTGLLGSVGISAIIFKKFADHGVNIHFISQSLSEYSISFAVKREKEQLAETVLKTFIDEKTQSQFFDMSYSLRPVKIVSVYGQGMKNIPGISGQIYSALGKEGINVIAASQGGEELSISIVVEEEDVRRAQAALTALIS